MVRTRMALDELHLFKDEIFYAMTTARTMHCSPRVRGYAEGAKPRIPVKEGEDWFYRHMPAILLEKNIAKEYQPTLTSTLMVYESLRFDKGGRVTHVHPCLIYLLCKFFVAARNGTRINYKKIHESSLYDGPKKLMKIRAPDDLATRVKRIATVTMTKCKARKCRSPGAPIHPKSNYIVGMDVCTKCMSMCFDGDTDWWFSLSQITKWFQEGFTTATTLCWTGRPLRYILVGIISCRALGQPHRSLDAYARVGKIMIEAPIDRLVDHWPIDKKTLRFVSSLYGPLAWRQIYTMWDSHKKIANPNNPIYRVLMSPVFRYMGWLPMPSGTWAPAKELCGMPLDSIDSDFNDTTE